MANCCDGARLKIDLATGLKSYIAASVDYMCEELTKAVQEKRTPDGRRHFGAALHVLEDYFAHSNFVELGRACPVDRNHQHKHGEKQGDENISFPKSKTPYKLKMGE